MEHNLKQGVDGTGVAIEGVQSTKERSKRTAVVIQEQLATAAIITRDAAYSGAWIWPVQGQYHFFTHPTLFKPILPAIISATLVTSFVTIILFIFTYLPTVAVLSFVNGPLAFLTAIPVIIGEGAAIGFFFAKFFWLQDAMTNLFDEVLIRNGCTKLVSRGRELNQGRGHGKTLGKILTKPLDRFSKESVIRWIISIPLNAIPLIGPTFFFLYNGARSGPSYHARYFQLKSLATSVLPAQSDGTKRSKGVAAFSQKEVVQRNRGAYSAFGAMAMALNVLVPGGVVLCMCGNQVGAALWAVEMERAEQADKKE